MKFVSTLIASMMFCFSANAADITKLVVDKASHTLTAYDGDTVVGTYDVIYGKPISPTPSFTTTFNSIDINPTWNPTAKSQSYMRQHPEQIESHGIHYKSDGTMYAPPGPKNPLGKARLNLQYGPPPIRIHGTSQPELFDTPTRRYSSGCIRVLKIRDLVTSIVDGPIDWDTPNVIKLKHPIEVIVK